MNDHNLKIKSGGYVFDFDNDSRIIPLVTDGNTIKLIAGDEIIEGEVFAISKSRNKYKVYLNGEAFEVTIKNQVEQTLEAMGLNKPKLVEVKEIKAPMPGLVIEIDLEVGQKIEKDGNLLILEAMKMENVIKLPNEGVIKNILVKKGQAVEKGQLLIEMK